MKKRMKFARTLAMGFVCAVVLSASLGHAQDESDGTAVEPETETSDFAGCWVGPVNDKNHGEGSGFLLISQDGDQIVKGTIGAATTTSFCLRGEARGQSFKIHHDHGNCHVDFHGTMAADPFVHLAGTYFVSSGCESFGGGDRLGDSSFRGTFDFVPAACSAPAG